MKNSFAKVKTAWSFILRATATLILLSLAFSESPAFGAAVSHPTVKAKSAQSLNIITTKVNSSVQVRVAGEVELRRLKQILVSNPESQEKTLNRLEKMNNRLRGSASR